MPAMTLLATPTNVTDKSIINLDNNDVSTSYEATTKETNTADSTPNGAAQAKDFLAKKVFMDLNFKMLLHEDLKEAMDLAIKRSKQ